MLCHVGDDQNRLASAIRARRIELGLSAREAAEMAGVSRNAWIYLEAGRTRMQQRHYAGVERALDWKIGSVAAVLAGEAAESATTETFAVAGGHRVPARHLGEPAVPDDLAAEVERIRGLRLPAAQKVRMVRALIELYAEAEDDAERAIG